MKKFRSNLISTTLSEYDIFNYLFIYLFRFYKLKKNSFTKKDYILYFLIQIIYLDLNECTSGRHSCNSVTQNCNNVGNGGGYTCSCKTGYYKSGSSCYDYNECYYNTDGCAHYCSNTPGSYSCSCRTGYYLSSYNGKSCYDINECSRNTDGCAHYCRNTAGSYYCDCNAGYELSSNRKTCVDINECSRNTDNCAQICRNTVGSFTCSCNTGYTLSSGRYCNDINECSSSNGGCAHTCTNNAGSFTCTCNTGYYLSSNRRSCLDTNECASNNGRCQHYCTNTVGSFRCSCRSGYYLTGNRRSCYDINECTSSSHGCEHYCENSVGTYSCRCSTGYTLASDGKACEDINECQQVPRLCNQLCTNSEGSYTCGCISGYRLDSDKSTCLDIDECTENSNLCPSPKKCVNQPGTYRCDCLPGYQKLQNPERCVDIDECTSGTHLCEQTCTNTVGSYDCSCGTNYYPSSSYSCEIITFTTSISLNRYSYSYAQFRARIQFDPTTYSVRVTNQIHALDLSFGNGKYEVNSPTTSSYPYSTSLKPYRVYRFYVTTTGTLYSVNSNNYTLRTATSRPSAPPSNVRVTASTATTLRVEWAAPPSTDRNGIITSYTLQYRMESASSYTTLSPTTATLASIVSLNEFTEYQVKVAASTSHGLGPYSDVIVATTNESRPISPPQIQVTNVGTNEISITLSPPTIDGINGILTEYQVVYYGESIDQTVNTIDVLPDTNWISSVNTNLTQLQENVVYHIKSRILTKIGSGPYSVDIIRKTLPSVPSGAPIDLTIDSVQTTSLSLSWDPPLIREQNSDSVAYKLQYYGNNFDTRVRNATTTNTNIVLTGLEEGEVYTVVVCVSNSEGDGPCEAIEEQTQEDIPTGYPQSVNAIALHDTSIRIFWNPLLADQANGAILRYEVSVKGTQHDSQTHLYSTNETIITVNNLEEYERYLVKVRANNTIGAGPYSITVEVRTHEDVPDGAPRNLQATASMETILVTWNAPIAADINGQITTYELHYAGTLEDMSNRTMQVGNVTQYRVSNLEADETYLIQVRVYTSVGAGPYTNWIAIRTMEDAPTSPPTDVTTIAHSSTAIEVMWKTPVRQGQNGVITGYDVEITAVSSNYTAMQSVGQNIDMVTFTNLEPYRQYSLRVAAKTQAGVGPASQPITEQTLQDIPEVAPSSLHIRNATALSVTLGWTPVSEDAINGILQHYELVTSAFHSTIKVDPELTSYTLLGLMPNTRYSVKIAAETSPGTGPYTSPLNFSTLEAAPSEGPNIHSVNSITSTSFVIVWSATPESVQNGALTGYEISVSEESTGVIVFDRVSGASGTRITVSDLNEYTRYRASVKAINSAGSSPSSVFSVETAQSKPTSPPLYISSIANTTSIELNWFAPNEQDQNGIITGYIIHINDRTVTTNVTEYTFQNLEEAMPYVIQLAAVTIVGIGPFSTAINITTLPIAPTAPPQDVNATAIASDEIRVTWKPIPILEQNGNILHYILHYWVRNLNNSLEIISINTTEVTLESLEPNTVYAIVLFAVNVVGNSPMCNLLTVKTWEDIPTVPPGNFSVEVLSPSSVQLTWSQIPSVERNGILIHQTITFQGSILDTDRHAINTESNRTKYTFTDLHPSVTYNFSLHQSTIVGNGPRSYATITMPEANPTAAPEYVQIVNIETGFHVEWNELPLTSRNGAIIQYEISLMTVYNGSNANASSMLYNSTNTEIGLTNLTASTLYSIQVRAMTSAGYGPYSQLLAALTAPMGLECFGYFSLYEQDPCQNGAVCKPENTNDFTCECSPGYEGTICENEINECLSRDCEHGTCIDEINNFTCNCYAGYSGRFCEFELNECSSGPCQNGGTCIDHLDSYECFCTSEYLGPDCEYPNKCLEKPCQHGTCHPVQDKYACSCENGYNGENCEVNINDCADVVCENGGQCLDGFTKFDCTCYFGYKGRYCQYPAKELTCESETISLIKWPATEYSKTSVMPCKYIDPTFVIGNATRKCSQSGVWKSPDMTECQREPFDTLFTHLHQYDDVFGEQTQINAQNITEVLRNVAYIVCGRSIMSPQEIMLSLNLTEYALNSISKLNAEDQSNLIRSLLERFLCIFSTIVSTNNVEFFSGNYQNMTNSLFRNLNLFSTLSAQTFIKTPNNTCDSLINSNINFTVKEIDINTSKTSINVLSDCDQTNITSEENSILFPPSLINALIDSNAKLGVSVLYSKTVGQILTRSSSGPYAEYEPASTLAMVELATNLPNQLKDPIHLNFSILNTGQRSLNPHCVYWDSATQGWSEQGLSVYNMTHDSITCASTHLSTFMVLFEDVILESNLVDPILTYIIYVVYGISLLCLTLAIVMMISLGKKLVESDIYIAQFSLGFAITLSVTIHLIGLINYQPIRDNCNIIAEIVYFFSIVSSTCFLAEGAAICFRFVLIKLKRRIHILLLALGWIVPIPLAVFRGVLDLEDLGIQDKYCWFSSKSSVIWSMTEPIAFILFVALIGMLVSILRCCSIRKIEQVRIARFALSGHMMLAPFILAPWALTIADIYVVVPYYRWGYSSLIALQGILFLFLYAIRNKTIRTQLRNCKNRKPKDGENDHVLEEIPLPLHPSAKPEPINSNIGFSNPIYDEKVKEDRCEGATPYQQGKLSDVVVPKQPVLGHINRACDNDYEELNFLESKVDNPFPSEMDETSDTMSKQYPIEKRPSLFSDDNSSGIEDKYCTSPSETVKTLPGELVIANKETCGDANGEMSIELPGDVAIVNDEVLSDDCEKKTIIDSDEPKFMD